MNKINTLSKKVSRLSFTVTENDFVNTSSTSKGNQMKFLHNGIWMKEDYLGYESLSEVIVSLFCSCIENLNYVKYNLCTLDFEGDLLRYCCCCSSFLESDETFISLGRLMDLENYDYVRELNIGRDTLNMNVINKILSIINKYTKLDAREYLGTHFYLDSIVLNEDRHFHNLGVIQSKGIFKFAPVFDNGLSLLSDLNCYSFTEHPLENINRVKAKPFSKDFNTQNNLAHQWGVPLLKLDYDKFKELIENYKFTNIPSLYVDRCLSVINYNLNRLEGEAWEKV